MPIDQVAPKWARPFDAKKFTAEFTFDPTKLATSPSGQMRVVEVFKETGDELFELSETTVTPHAAMNETFSLASRAALVPGLSLLFIHNFSGVRSEGEPGGGEVEHSS